jgi:MYXO-CTERM domain-containing protein
VSATLTWAVDAPRSPFVVPVSLDYIESGTAVSPASVSVPAITIGQVSNRYTVTLQNCNAAPVMVTIDGVIASRGDAAAWEVQPRVDARTLAPQDKLTITVAFAPKRHGRHVAQIRLGIDGEERLVLLEGDGIDPDFKRTSFYACGCSSRGRGGDLVGGWPIVIAIAAVVRRRRRRRS